MTALSEAVKTKPASIKMLAEGKIGARLVTFKSGLQAVMKIASSVTTKRNRDVQRGLPTKTFPDREVAFYKLSEVMRQHDAKFDVVPETVLGEFNGYKASFQQYATSAKLYELDPRLRNPKEHATWVIALRETLRDKLPVADVARLTILDFLACARDRHAANYGARLSLDGGKAGWRVVGWDNGCTFGLTQENYHCVAHKYLFRFAFDLEPVWKALQTVKRSEIVNALKGLVSDAEADHVWMRVQFVNMFPHRMPWVTLSNGSDSSDAFPTYAGFFRPMAKEADKPLYILHAQGEPGYEGDPHAR